MSIFEETSKDMLTPVRFGDGEKDFVLSWAASGMLRKLREKHEEIFSQLLAEVIDGNKSKSSEEKDPP